MELLCENLFRQICELENFRISKEDQELVAIDCELWNQSVFNVDEVCVFRSEVVQVCDLLVYGIIDSVQLKHLDERDSDLIKHLAHIPMSIRLARLILIQTILKKWIQNFSGC